MGKSGQTDTIRLFNTHYSEDCESYKRYAENRSNAYKYTQEYLTDLTYRIKDYLREQQESEEPFTVSGLFMALEMQKKDYYRAKNGDFDWKLYQFADFHGLTLDDLDNLDEIRDDQLGKLDIWTDENGEIFICNTYSEIIEKALNHIQDQLESLCCTSNNPRGAIFILKSRFGWSDKPDLKSAGLVIGNIAQDQPTATLNHVASYEEAKQALSKLQLPEDGSAGDEADLNQIL